PPHQSFPLATDNETRFAATSTRSGGPARGRSLGRTSASLARPIRRTRGQHTRGRTPPPAAHSSIHPLPCLTSPSWALITSSSDACPELRSLPRPAAREDREARRSHGWPVLRGAS